MAKVEVGDVSAEAFRYWKTQDPVTVTVFRKLKTLRAQLRNRALDSVLNPESADATLAAASRLKGTIEGIELLLEITFEGDVDE